MKLAKSVLAGALAAAAFTMPAIAQTAGAAANVTVGATVSDTSGNPVGTIEAVNGDLAVLSTGANKVSLPLSSFGAGTKGPVIAMTKAEVDAAAAGAAAAAKADAAAQTRPAPLSARWSRWKASLRRSPRRTARCACPFPPSPRALRVR